MTGKTGALAVRGVKGSEPSEGAEEGPQGRDERVGTGRSGAASSVPIELCTRGQEGGCNPGSSLRGAVGGKAVGTGHVGRGCLRDFSHP